MWKSIYDALYNLAVYSKAKLPLIWPDMLVIGAALRRIALVLGSEIVGFGATGPSTEAQQLVDLAREHGLREEEAMELAGIANLSDHAPQTPPTL